MKNHLPLRIPRVRLLLAGCLAAFSGQHLPAQTPEPAAPAPVQAKAIAPELTGATLLDKVIRHPGLYSQICDVQILPSPAPIPGFRQITQGEAFLSEPNLEALRKSRTSVLAAISQRLATLDIFAKAKSQPLDPNIKKDEEGNFESDSEPRGYDPSTYNIMLLRILQDLDGADALPGLLVFEEKFFASLKKVEKDPTQPLPTVDGLDTANVAMEGLFNDERGAPVDYDQLTDTQKRVFERRARVFRANAAHRDMLGVMVKLMRRDGFEPMLRSTLEKEYGQLLKDKWKEYDELAKYQKTEDIPEDEQDHIKYDPLHKVAYYVWDPVQVPYIDEKRSMILQLTQEFLQKRSKVPAKAAEAPTALDSPQEKSK